MGDGDVNSNLLIARSTGDAQLDRAVGQWLSWDKNPKTKEQIENLVRNGMNKELRDRLCCRLTFGTAGLRSAMGAGFCYINDLTVIQSTQCPGYFLISGQMNVVFPKTHSMEVDR